MTIVQDAFLYSILFASTIRIVILFLVKTTRINTALSLVIIVLFVTSLLTIVNLLLIIMC